MSEEKTTARERAEMAAALALQTAYSALNMIAAMPDAAASAAARAALSDIKETINRVR